jgi:hypothetical protein
MHQTWDLLGFLLRRSAFPVDIVHGEEPLAADDWGYGPPQYLTPDRVRLRVQVQLVRGLRTTLRALDESIADSVAAHPYAQSHIPCTFVS